MRVSVEIWTSQVSMVEAYARGFRHRKGTTPGCIASYSMNHNSVEERLVLGEQCRNAFEGGQLVVTKPEAA